MKKVLFIFILLLIVLAPTFSYTLSELEGVMLNNNTSIIKQREEVKKAELDLKDAKSNFQPTIKGTGSFTYMTEPIIGKVTIDSSDILGQMGVGGSGGLVTLYDGMENTMYQFGISITEPLVTWGKLTGAVKAYKEVSSAQGYLLSDTIKMKKAELKMRSYALEMVKELDDKLDEASALSEELVSLVESGYKNGMMIEEDYLSAKISLNELDMKKAELQKQKNEILYGLRILTGINDLSFDDLEIEVDESVYLKYRDVDKSELKNSALSSSNDALSAAKSQIEVYKTQQDISKRSFYGIPDFALQVDLNYSGSRFPLLERGWNQKDKGGINISIGFQSTLWDGGKILNNIDRAESNLRGAENTLKDAILQIENTLSSTLNSMDYSFLNIDYLESKKSLEEIKLNNILINEEYGEKSRSDEIQKRLEIISLDSQIINEKISLMQNACTLDYLVT